MPHIRRRYIESILKNGLRHKGIVGVFGHRQVGKTTLLELLSKRYSTLDRRIELTRAEENPEAFLAGLYGGPGGGPAAIDECQLSPILFPELKEFVRNHKEPGIFLLSGSVRFSSRKAIRESLMGRILTYELLPFSVSELNQRPLNTLALDLMNCLDLRRIDFRKYHSRAKGLARNKEAKKYLKLGGLPGLCFTRNERARIDLMESQLDLVLDRDLRLVCSTNLEPSRLRIVVQILAENQNQPLNLAEIARKTRISQPTLKKILAGLEAIFFVRQIPCEGDEARPILFFEDQGEAFYLSGKRYDEADDLERLAFAHLRIPFAYAPGLAFQCFQYRRQGGAYVPIAFKSGEKTIGFICSLTETPSLSAIRSAGSFLRSYPGSSVIHLHPFQKPSILGAREASLPMEYFL